MFGTDKRMAVAEVGPGECAYVPQGCGHSLQNVGSEQANVVGVLNSGVYSESSLSAWLINAPPHLLANNFGLPHASVAKFNKRSPIVAAL
jgi:oxalate decarboxylase